MRPAGPLDRPEEIAGAALEGLVAQHLYRGRETLEIDRIRCLPCEDFLRGLIPGQPLP